MPAKTAKLWIPGVLPGQNELIAAAKSGGGRGYVYAKIKREWTETIEALCKAARIPCQTGPVRFAFTWREAARRRDPDNFTGGGRKLILDGLIAGGVLEGDGWRHVAGFTDTWEVDADTPGVMVEIRPA